MQHSWTESLWSCAPSGALKVEMDRFRTLLDVYYARQDLALDH